MINPFNELRAIFAVHVMLEIAKVPINTEPKSTGLHVRGTATGDPYPYGKS
jgi:hypothetical protein